MRHVTGRGSLEGCQYVSSGVYYRQLTRVQSLTCHEFAFRPIKIIAQNGEAVMCKVQPDLMGATSHWCALYQTRCAAEGWDSVPLLLRKLQGITLAGCPKSATPACPANHQPLEQAYHGIGDPL